MKIIAPVKSALKSRFFLPESPKDHQVSVPRLMIIRVRWIVGLSMAFNLFLFTSLVSLMDQNNLDQEIVHDIARLAEITKHLSDLYSLQIEDLAAAYTLYGQSIQVADAETQKQLLNGYREKLENFNTRSYEMTNVSTAIRSQAQKVAAKFQEKRQ